MNPTKNTADIKIEPYDEFAGLYDGFMEHVPFEHWARYLLAVASEYFGNIPDQVCDLACGTGKIIYFLKPYIKKIYGLDGNMQMLKAAKKRSKEAKFYQGNLIGPMPFRKNQFQWMLCTHDSLNYITDPSDMALHFAEVNRILCPGGLYSTDIVTLQNIVRNFDGKSSIHTVSGRSFKWSNTYNRKTKKMLSTLEFLSGDKKTLVEEHYQRYYTVTEIKKIAEKAGFTLYLKNGDYNHKSISNGEILTNLHFIKS